MIYRYILSFVFGIFSRLHVMFGGRGIHGRREKEVQVEVFMEMRFDGISVGVKIGNLGSCPFS